MANKDCTKRIFHHFLPLPEQSTPTTICDCYSQIFVTSTSLLLSSRKKPCRGWLLRWRPCWTRVMRSLHPFLIAVLL